MRKIHAQFVENESIMSKITLYPLPPEISGFTHDRCPPMQLCCGFLFLLAVTCKPDCQSSSSSAPYTVVYSTITLVLISALHLIMSIIKSEIHLCGDSSNTPKSVEINFFFCKISICVKLETVVMTQLPGGQSCAQGIY